ncbi:hypothetical protein Q3G72_034479 [Acer saccharum]|nr:hypothetical protein Q3G72_034479 [Acer saccharum]
MDQNTSLEKSRVSGHVEINVVASKTSKLKGKKAEGSRCTVLSEYNDGESSGKETQRHTDIASNLKEAMAMTKE